MVRRERCPQCGSKRFTITEKIKKCDICSFEWTGKTRGKATEKGTLRTHQRLSHRKIRIAKLSATQCTDV